MWDLRTGWRGGLPVGSCAWPPEPGEPKATCATHLFDGFVLIGDAAGGLRVLKVDAGGSKLGAREVGAHGSRPLASASPVVALLPQPGCEDGRVLAAQADGSLRLLDFGEEGGGLLSLASSGPGLTAVSWVDDMTLATAHAGGLVQLWALPAAAEGWRAPAAALQSGDAAPQMLPGPGLVVAGGADIAQLQRLGGGEAGGEAAALVARCGGEEIQILAVSPKAAGADGRRSWGGATRLPDPPGRCVSCVLALPGGAAPGLLASTPSGLFWHPGPVPATSSGATTTVPWVPYHPPCGYPLADATAAAAAASPALLNALHLASSNAAVVPAPDAGTRGVAPALVRTRGPPPAPAGAGRVLAVGCSAGSVALWDASGPSLSLLATIPAPEQPVTVSSRGGGGGDAAVGCLALSASRRLLAVGASSVLRVYDLAADAATPARLAGSADVSGSCSDTTTDNRPAVCCVTFCPGRPLAFASTADGGGTLLSLPACDVMLTLPPTSLLSPPPASAFSISSASSHEAAVLALFATDARTGKLLLLTAGSGGSVGATRGLAPTPSAAAAAATPPRRSPRVSSPRAGTAPSTCVIRGGGGGGGGASPHHSSSAGSDAPLLLVALDGGGAPVGIELPPTVDDDDDDDKEEEENEGGGDDEAEASSRLPGAAATLILASPSGLRAFRVASCALSPASPPHGVAFKAGAHGSAAALFVAPGGAAIAVFLLGATPRVAVYAAASLSLVTECAPNSLSPDYSPSSTPFTSLLIASTLDGHVFSVWRKSGDDGGREGHGHTQHRSGRVSRKSRGAEDHAAASPRSPPPPPPPPAVDTVVARIELLEEFSAPHPRDDVPPPLWTAPAERSRALRGGGGDGSGGGRSFDAHPSFGGGGGGGDSSPHSSYSGPSGPPSASSLQPLPPPPSLPPPQTQQLQHAGGFGGAFRKIGHALAKAASMTGVGPRRRTRLGTADLESLFPPVKTALVVGGGFGGGSGGGGGGAHTPASPRASPRASRDGAVTAAAPPRRRADKAAAAEADDEEEDEEDNSGEANSDGGGGGEPAAARPPAGASLERVSLFTRVSKGGAASARTTKGAPSSSSAAGGRRTAEEIRAAYGRPLPGDGGGGAEEVATGMRALLGKAGERTEKLNQIGDKTAAMENDALAFRDAARELAKKQSVFGW